MSLGLVFLPIPSCENLLTLLPKLLFTHRPAPISNGPKDDVNTLSDGRSNVNRDATLGFGVEIQGHICAWDACIAGRTRKIATSSQEKLRNSSMTKLGVVDTRMPIVLTVQLRVETAQLLKTNHFVISVRFEPHVIKHVFVNVPFCKSMCRRRD
eukprot:c12159_g1_i2.p1 GENE.c12159_g1_i2~~c12159_g1_i2.p1  ORF type:complete len:154 (-),score=23.48 c12159_g1_i2:327-788(-)